MIIEIEISNITLPQGLLPRVLTGTIEEKIEEYKEAYQQNEDMPPISVWKKNTQYWIVDGVHRLEAQKRLGRNIVKAKLLDLKDELDYRKKAIELNKHGIPLKKEEKEILAKTLYKSGLNINELCKLFSVSERTIYRWIDELINQKEIQRIQLINKAKELREQGFSQEQVAKELKVSQQTVSYWEENSPNFDILSNFGNLTNSNNSLTSSNILSNSDKDFPPFNDLNKILEEDDEELVSDEIGKDLSRYVIDDELEETKELLQPKEKKSKGGRPISRLDKLAPFDAEKQLEILYERIQFEVYKIAGIWGYDKAIEVLHKLIDDVNEDWEGHPGTGHPKAILPKEYYQNLNLNIK